MGEKLKSRKFITTIIVIILESTLPIFFSRSGVPEGVMLMALGTIAAAGGIYAGANVMSKP